MSDDTTQPQQQPAPATQQDDALGAFNYSPPAHVNTNQFDAAAMQAAIQAHVAAALAQHGITPPAPQKSPEEAARDKIANAGAGLGTEERLKEIYELFAHLAQKVGL